MDVDYVWHFYWNCQVAQVQESEQDSDGLGYHKTYGSG